jgi:hypothetical protein
VGILFDDLKPEDDVYPFPTYDPNGLLYFDVPKVLA